MSFPEVLSSTNHLQSPASSIGECRRGSLTQPFTEGEEEMDCGKRGPDKGGEQDDRELEAQEGTKGAKKGIAQVVLDAKVDNLPS